MNPDHNPDHTIDRVLHGLRDATPPAGMDRRILNTLEAKTQHAASRQSRPDFAARLARPFLREKSFEGVVPGEAKRSRETPAFNKPLRWTAIAVFDALIAAAVMIAFTTHRNPSPATATSAARAAQQATLPTIKAAPIRHATASTVRTRTHRMETAQHADEAPVRHPAPPLPLTDQERLLLLIAHRQPPFQLAGLTAEQLAVRSEKERVDFENFFAPLITEIPDDATQQQ